ncbi:MAG: flavoprotein [Candidatus Eisenbacteria bacterium]
MQTPARQSLAIVGAGPVGLEAAARALELGFDVHVFERGEIGAHLRGWGHVRMFTPWRMNVGPAGERLLAANGWTAPPADECPTGDEFADRVLLPLAATDALRARVHAHQQVVKIARRGLASHERIGDPARAEAPFRLLVRDAGGRESVLHAFAVLDATGTFGQPAWAGTGGMPARGELYLAPQMSYRPDDVLGLRRERHAGKRTLVVGGGASAATTVTALAKLALEEPGTQVTWVTRETGPLAGEVANDPLPARAALYAEAHALRGGANPAVAWIGGAEVEGFEYNTGTHRYRVTLQVGEQARVEEVEQVVLNVGYVPDLALTSELQAHFCWATRGSMKLATELLGGAAGTDCMVAPEGGAGVLAHPEPNYFAIGARSYGRNSAFLLRTGYAQAEDALTALAASLR